MSVVALFFYCFVASVSHFGFSDWNIQSFLPNNSLFELCLFHAATDLRCVGCGMSRAFLNISIFNFKTAFELNPISVILFPSLLIWIISPYVFKHPPLKLYSNKIVLWTVLILLIVFWGFRIYQDIQ